MRLLKGQPDETVTDETVTDEAETDEPVVEHTSAEPRGARARTRSAGHHWFRRTVTVPMTVPERSVKRSVVVPSRPVDRASGWPRVSPGSVVAIAAGAALAIAGCVVLLRTGLDETWFRPRTEVLDADHTALLGVLEIGAGLILLLAGLTGSRVLVAILGLALALGATALAIEPEELQRELAIERWWAWTLAAIGVVVTLSALQAPRERRKAVVDV
jgi:hypothetical protein